MLVTICRVNRAVYGNFYVWPSSSEVSGSRTGTRACPWRNAEDLKASHRFTVPCVHVQQGSYLKSYGILLNNGTKIIPESNLDPSWCTQAAYISSLKPNTKPLLGINFSKGIGVGSIQTNFSWKPRSLCSRSVLVCTWNINNSKLSEDPWEPLESPPIFIRTILSNFYSENAFKSLIGQFIFWRHIVFLIFSLDDARRRHIWHPVWQLYRDMTMTFGQSESV